MMRWRSGSKLALVLAGGCSSASAQLGGQVVVLAAAGGQRLFARPSSFPRRFLQASLGRLRPTEAGHFVVGALLLLCHRCTDSVCCVAVSAWCGPTRPGGPAGCGGQSWASCALSLQTCATAHVHWASLRSHLDGTCLPVRTWCSWLSASCMSRLFKPGFSGDAALLQLFQLGIDLGLVGGDLRRGAWRACSACCGQAHGFDLQRMVPGFAPAWLAHAAAR